VGQRCTAPEYLAKKVNESNETKLRVFGHYTSKETLVGVMRDQYKTSDGVHLPDHLAVLARAYKRTNVAHTYGETRAASSARVSARVCFECFDTSHENIARFLAAGSGVRCRKIVLFPSE